MGIQVKIEIDKYSLECSLKYSSPYLLCLFLFAVWLFSPSIAILLKGCIVLS